MILLHSIGPKPDGPASANYNTREQIESAIERNEHLTFDGIYLNVWENRDLLWNCKEAPILFIMGNYVGGDNKFDIGMPFEKYCDWNQIMDLVLHHGCQLGWHTWSHRNLCTLSDEEAIKEVTPPFPMKYFAYPYGAVDFRVQSIVEAAGYDEAYSVFQGSGDAFTRKREYL